MQSVSTNPEASHMEALQIRVDELEQENSTPTGLSAPQPNKAEQLAIPKDLEKVPATKTLNKTALAEIRHQKILTAPPTMKAHNHRHSPEPKIPLNNISNVTSGKEVRRARGDVENMHYRSLMRPPDKKSVSKSKRR